MRVRTSRPLLLTALLYALVVLGSAAAPARPSQAAGVSSNFVAWNLSVDFASGSPYVLATSYSGSYNPPAIVSSTVTDISAQCVKFGPGQIIYQNGRATFDGASFLRCPLPVVIPTTTDCEITGTKFFWFAANVKLDPTAQSNPIFEASDGSFAASLPSNGAQARTRVRLRGQVYQTPNWPRDGAGNQALMGQYGPMIIKASSELDLLTFLDPGWQTWFQTVGETNVGHRMYSAGGTQTWKTNAVLVPYAPPTSSVDIGYSAASGAFFRGEIANLEFDPPGCIAK